MLSCQNEDWRTHRRGLFVGAQQWRLRLGGKRHAAAALSGRHRTRRGRLVGVPPAGRGRRGDGRRGSRQGACGMASRGSVPCLIPITFLQIMIIRQLTCYFFGNFALMQNVLLVLFISHIILPLLCR